MKDILHESKWCCVDQEGGTETAEVVEMLDGMHWEASERLNVCVPVVDAVDVFVHRGDVDKSEIKHFVSTQENWNKEPVCKVEVELSVEGHPEGSK